MVKDCHGNPLPVFCKGIVENCSVVESAFPKNSVYLLKVKVNEDNEPAAGQFFMLHCERSNFLLGRPISIFHAKKENGVVFLEFLILKKGEGTGTCEICSLQKGDKISLLGPCGNSFEVINNDFFAYGRPSIGCVWTSSTEKAGHLLGKVYSIRLYNRLLTEEERYNNMVVDYMRFRIPIMDEFKMNLTNDLGEKITKA